MSNDNKELIANTKFLIRKSVAGAFEAFVDPDGTVAITGAFSRSIIEYLHDFIDLDPIDMTQVAAFFEKTVAISR